MFGLILWSCLLPIQQGTENFQDAKLPIDSNESFGGVKVKTAVSDIEKLRSFQLKYDPTGYKNAVLGRREKDLVNVSCGRGKDFCFFMFKGISVTYKIPSGRLSNISFGQPDQEESKELLSVRECSKTIKELFKYVCDGRDIELTEVDLSGSTDWVRLNFVQLAPGSRFPIGTPVSTIVSRINGMPEYMYIPELPIYAECKTVVSKEDAVTAAIISINELTGWTRFSIGVRNPRYRIPAFSLLNNAMTQKHTDCERKKLATLMYEISVSDASSYNENEKMYERRHQILVDAESGKTIAATPFFNTVGDLSVSTPPMPIESQTWSCGNKTGYLRKIGEAAPKSGKTVVLQGPKGAAIIGKYSEKSHRFFFMQAFEWIVTIPDKELEHGMKTYVPSPFENQPILKRPK